MGELGRPTKYKEEYNEQAYKLCLLGHTDAELASFFEVSEATINNWKIDFPSFLESIKKGKEFADVDVVQSLYKRATGMKLTKQVVKESGIVEVEDEIAPDTTAMIFWLKNRQPKKWRDKQDIQHSGVIGSELSDEDLDARIKALQNDQS
ncbi:MAG: hypothetical protein GAK29_01431 [Acinetobacter bereziniae]|uniref:Terminase n=1 Tax=Acinetobacter bereziniae TaxID=106648 RepID=A0A833UDQ4_ACIBZ|nr:MAG: hypothetical protein GAK29_01431 [Acinetobacter bereziniae]